MPLTLLLDLDDTLLDTDMAAFLPAYYDSLSRHLSPWVAPDSMLHALRSGVELMQRNTDPGKTLQQVFEAHFYPKLGTREETLRSAVDDFYSRVFPALGTIAHRVPGARELVDWAIAAGHQVVLATDPLFPLQATEERVRWAGIDPAGVSLISSFESFHFSKVHVDYFAELLGRLGWPDQPILMVGNDLERDILPAQAIGLDTFRVSPARSQPAAAGGNASMPDPAADGDLGALLDLLRGAELRAYVPAFNARSTVLSALRATPAVLHSMAMHLDSDAWKVEPSPKEWAMIELVCHLRDTEREVHAEQIHTLIDSAAPFVSRPDAAVWAKQRRYLSEDGPGAVRAFVAARMAALNRLVDLPDAVWSKPARHAIFGPTNLGEVVRFMADHDRLHLQQAYGILQLVQAPAHRS
jgi:FMN phosphatase YigB (HAD superfamily)